MKGTEVIDSNGVHWTVLKDIGNAQAQPREGANYARVLGPTLQEQLDKLATRVSKLEAADAPPAVVPQVVEPPVVKPPIVVPSEPTLDFEKYAGSVYKAGNSLKYGTTTKAADQDSVGTIADSKGVADLLYQGLAKPSVIGVNAISPAYSGRPPILTIGPREAPYISMPNLPGIHYLTKQMPSETFPFAMTFVMRSLPGQDYESWCMAPYISEYEGKLRVGGPDIHTDIDCPSFFRIDIIHIEVDSNNCKIWMNNVYKGSVPSSKWTAAGAHRRDRNALGKETNGAPFDWFATYIYYNRNMPDLVKNRDTILAGIAKEYKMGSMPTLPYCDDVLIDKQGGFYKVSFTPYNATSAQIAATEFRWFLCEKISENGGGSFGKQLCIGDKSTLPTTAITGSNHFLSCYVKIGGAVQSVKSWPWRLG